MPSGLWVLHLNLEPKLYTNTGILHIGKSDPTHIEAIGPTIPKTCSNRFPRSVFKRRSVAGGCGNWALTRRHLRSGSFKCRPKTKAAVNATIDEVSAGVALDDGVADCSVLIAAGAPGVRYKNSRMPAATSTKAAPNRRAAIWVPKAALSMSKPQNTSNPAPVTPIRNAMNTN